MAVLYAPSFPLIPTWAGTQQNLTYISVLCNLYKLCCISKRRYCLLEFQLWILFKGLLMNLHIALLYLVGLPPPTPPPTLCWIHWNWIWSFPNIDMHWWNIYTYSYFIIFIFGAICKYLNNCSDCSLYNYLPYTLSHLFSSHSLSITGEKKKLEHYL